MPATITKCVNIHSYSKSHDVLAVVAMAKPIQLEMKKMYVSNTETRHTNQPLQNQTHSVRHMETSPSSSAFPGISLGFTTLGEIFAYVTIF